LEAAGQELLIDCGSGTLLQLARAGKSYRSVDAVLVTHTHPDHIGDLMALIHALKVTPGFRREKPLRFFGPPGFLAFYERSVAPVARKPKNFDVQVTEVGAVFDLSGLRISTTPTVHSNYLNSVAYRFEMAGKSLVVSGDCDYDAGIIQHARDADVLVLDCSFPDALKVTGHLSAGQCGQVAAMANVHRLVLSHLYPVVVDQDSRIVEARAVFKGNIRLAEDLMNIEL
jgi:ribonuclease BN (tRNA processing enzyme)